MQTLITVTEQLKIDYKTKSFSTSSKGTMSNLLQKLNASTFNANFRKIINPLESILKEGLKEKKSAWGLKNKAYEKKFVTFIKEINALLANDLGKGFVSSNIKILQEQFISLKIIKKFFAYISVTILKK